MICKGCFSIKNLFATFLSMLLIEGQAQQLAYLNFSSISNTAKGKSWLSQSITTPLQSDCLSLHMGLGLHYALKRYGTFLLDCFETDTSSVIKFLLYPNPVHSTATLSVLAQGSFNQKIQLQLIDALGRQVSSQWVGWQDLQSRFLIDMSSLSAGIYFLIISSSSFNSVIKIIKI